MKVFSNQYTGTHIPSGETALLFVGAEEDKDKVQAQFDRFEHEHSHGWNTYPRSE